MIYTGNTVLKPMLNAIAREVSNVLTPGTRFVVVIFDDSLAPVAVTNAETNDASEALEVITNHLDDGAVYTK